MSGKKENKTQDGLASVLNKKNPGRDVTLRGNSYFYIEGALPYTEQEAMWITTWIGKKIIEIPNEYAFKNGFTFRIPDNEEVEAQILELYEKLNLEQLVRQACMNADLYGGSVLMTRHKLQNPMEEFNHDLLNSSPEGIDFFERDMTYITVVPHIVIQSRQYMKPKTISITGLTADASHFLIFTGVDLPIRRAPSYKYLGMSVYENVYRAILNDEMISSAIPNLVVRNNVYYYKMHGLSDLAKNKHDDLILSRLKLLEDSKSFLNAGVIDIEDDVSIVSQTFAGLADIDKRSIERLSAATGIPATILLGKSPDGMNSTGDADLEIFYNYIQAKQKRIEPNMKRLFKILVHIVTGKDLDFEFEFNKPQQVSKEKQSDIDMKYLENARRMQELGMPEKTMLEYLADYGIITTEEVDEALELENEMNELENDINEEDVKDYEAMKNKTESFFGKVKKLFKNIRGK